MSVSRCTCTRDGEGFTEMRGCPRHDPPDAWGELDLDGYNDARSAREGHLAMCDKWSSRPPESGAVWEEDDEMSSKQRNIPTEDKHTYDELVRRGWTPDEARHIVTYQRNSFTFAHARLGAAWRELVEAIVRTVKRGR
jgi:hypothetical protein